MEERWPKVGATCDLIVCCGFVTLAFKVEPVIRTAAAPSRAVVNAGLWLDDPDVDAITRLCNDIVATECDAYFHLPTFLFVCLRSPLREGTRGIPLT